MTLPVTYDLDTRPWPGHSEDASTYQKWSLFVKAFKSDSPSTLTQMQSNVLSQFICSRQIAIHKTERQVALCFSQGNNSPGSTELPHY